MAVLLSLTALLLCVAAAVIGLVGLLAWRTMLVTEALARRLSIEAHIAAQTAATVAAMDRLGRAPDLPPATDWQRPVHHSGSRRVRRFGI